MVLAMKTRPLMIKVEEGTEVQPSTKVFNSQAFSKNMGAQSVYRRRIGIVLN